MSEVTDRQVKKAHKRIMRVELGTVEHLDTTETPREFDSEVKKGEKKTIDYMLYGPGDGVHETLIEACEGSATNGPCIGGMTDLIYGDGIEVHQPEKHLEDLLAMRTLIPATDWRKVIRDYYQFGVGYLQVRRTGDDAMSAVCSHVQSIKIRPTKESVDGHPKGFGFCQDWSKAGREKEVQYLPNFLNKKEAEGAEISILRIMAYAPGHFYFTPPGYIGGLTYAQIETEIGLYHHANTKNGLVSGHVFQMNGGIPTEEEQEEIADDLKEKVTGSGNAGAVIVLFNESKEDAATIDSIAKADLDTTYEFLSEESSLKILRAHRIVSPLLVGIRDSTGFSSNADEIKNAFFLQERITVHPHRRVIFEAIEPLMDRYDINGKFYFQPLNPMQFLDDHQQANVSEEDKAEQTGVTMSKHNHDMSPETEKRLLKVMHQFGERMGPDWELVDSTPVDAQTESRLSYTELLNQYAEPSGRSADDGGLYRIRYQYGPQRTSNKSREFCKQMVAASKSGTVYRREDIDRMSRAGVNGQFSPQGKNTYDIFLHKGGAYCHHAWTRLVYKRKTVNGKVKPLTGSEKGANRDLKNYDRGKTAQAKSQGFPDKKLNPPGIKQAQTKPIDTPSRGKLN